MYNLFIFIRKYNAVILFILLEVLCFIMIVQSLPYHNRKMANVSNSISGGIHKTTSNWNDYLHLRSENEALVEHNALLLKRLGCEEAEADTAYYDDVFTYIPARVVNNSIYEMNNYIVIDKGSVDGIEPDMGVICSNGVVGKVLNVTQHFASVMSMLNSYSIMSCRFIDNQYVANVVWDNGNYRYGLVKDIPSHLIIKVGDTLVTSGFSNSFPADVLVGTIEEKGEDDENMFSTAKLKFSTNFSTLRYVYVVKNNFKSEIDSLCITH
ncbi:MAG: rod shape-determining protein MreC [Bacteroidales bacterium]|nr:rod shape-determining protein MreC [Bacteroidales bacterium]